MLVMVLVLACYDDDNDDDNDDMVSALASYIRSVINMRTTIK